MKKYLLLTGLLLTTSGCTTKQLTQTMSFIANGCAVVNAGESFDPSLASNKVINGVQYACTDAPAAEALAAQISGQVESLKSK